MDQEKYVLEFDMKSIPVTLLWNYISTANGLKQWFAEEVEIDNKNFQFSWEGISQSAHLIGMRLGAYIRLHWDDDDEPKSYFEMRISVNDLTDNIVLAITDFAAADEMEDAKELWAFQVDSLRRILGC